jgi:hypothetical protein
LRASVFVTLLIELLAVPIDRKCKGTHWTYQNKGANPPGAITKASFAQSTRDPSSFSVSFKGTLKCK